MKQLLSTTNNRFLSKTNPELARSINSGSQNFERDKIQLRARQIVDMNMWANLKLWTHSALIKYDTGDETFAYTQEWDSWPGFTTFNLSRSIAGSILSVTSSNGDPSITMSGLGSFNPNTFKWIEARYRITSGTAAQRESLRKEIFYLNSRRTSANGDQVVGSTYLKGTGDWAVVNIYMPESATYWTHSNITGWRYDVVNQQVNLDIDYIKFKSNRKFEVQTMYDLSGNRNDLINRGIGPIFNTGSLQLNFEGIAQSYNGNFHNSLYITKQITSTQNFTVMCWCKIRYPIDWHPTGDATLISEWGATVNDTTNPNYELRLLRAGRFDLIYRNTANTGFISSSAYTSSVAITDQQWYHVAATFDGTTNIGEHKIYINGQYQTGSAADGTVRPLLNTRTYIGQSGRTEAPFSGSIDDIRIFNNVFTADQINSVFQYTKTSYGY